MANYSKINNFTAKDSLASGDANKRVRGTEFDAEFNAISSAIATKPDSAGVTSVGGTGTASGLSLSGTVTSTGNLTLGGTVNSLAAGTYGISITGSAPYGSLTGKPASALRQVFSGVVSYGANTSRTYTFTILYSGVGQAREMPSTDSFVVVTALNDFYTQSLGVGGNANTSVTKNVQVYIGSEQSKLQVTLSGWRTSSPIIYPNQVNLTIFVQDVTGVASLTFEG